MSPILTRRDFLGDAAMAGVASALDLHAAPRKKLHESAPPERRANFDDQWKFLLGDSAGANAASFDDHTWRTLDLPHDWSIEGSFSEEAPAKGSGGYLPTGIGWYRKSFTLPTIAAGKRVVLEFDGVYQRSEVWINGISLGMRPYGFISFAYDLTPHLAPSGKPNQIAVRVDNSLQTNCRWYTGSGIYRHTWLRVTDPLHIAQWGIFVTTPTITPGSASVEVSTEVLNEGDREATFDLLTEILDASGKVVQQSSTSHTLPRGGDDKFVHSLTLASPVLWTQSAPHLYQLHATLRFRGVEVDREVTTFGVREARFDVDKGFLLNGERVKMNGVCIHGDAGPVGTAVPERMW